MATPTKPKAVWLSGLGGLATAGLILFGLKAEELFPRPLSPQEQIGQRWLRTSRDAGGYVGSEACRSCHAREAAAHGRSPHSRTVRQLGDGESRPEFAGDARITDPVHGVKYSVAQAEGKNWLIAEHKEKTYRAPVRWVFGSGTHAWSYLGQDQKGFLELRISYYRPDDTWNYTPGRGPQDELPHPLGHTYSSLQAAACFGCHGTVLVGDQKRLDLKHSHLNVGCESCHGPGREHVLSATSLAGNSPSSQAGGRVVRLGSPSGPESIRLCGACHRLPDDELAGDPAIEDQLARFPGIALLRSNCYLKSGGKLTCLTCHDPHDSVEKDTAYYDRKCGNCHATSAGSTCKAGKRAQCVSCHMPDQAIGRKLPLRFHNHWIRRNPNALETLRQMFSEVPRSRGAARRRG